MLSILCHETREWCLNSITIRDPIFLVEYCTSGLLFTSANMEKTRPISWKNKYNH
jgi:hypothetical protein